MSNSDASYLDKIQFPSSLNQSFIAKYLKNFRIPLLIILTLILVGVSSYNLLPKRLNPEVKIPIITVITSAPGSNATDIEDLITNPLEKQIKQLSNISEFNSISQDNLSLITIQFESKILAKDAQNDVQNKVNQANLQGILTTPQVQALDFEDQPIWTLAITGLPSQELNQQAQLLKENLENLSLINRVTLSGAPQNQININLDLQKIQNYGLNIPQISTAISQSLQITPAGSVSNNKYNFTVAIASSINNLDELRNLPISVGNQILPLGSIAQIIQQPKPNSSLTYISNSQIKNEEAVILSIYKNSQSDIVATGNQAQASIDQFITQNPQIKLTTLTNVSQDINQQFSDLIREFRTTILLVGGTLLLFLGVRQALISSLTVPLTFLSAFAIMQAFGQSINFLSLFAFLLALGLLVDDTIVIVSSMTSYYQTKKFTTLQTGLLVWRDTIVPIWSTTLTTIWSFVPLLLSSGIIGEFIKPIPIVVTATMLSSTAIAVFITLPLMIVILKPRIPTRVTILIKLITWIALLTAVIFISRNTPLLPLIITIFIIITIITLLIRNQLQTHTSPFQKQPSIKKISSFAQQLMDKRLINIQPLSNGYYNLIKRILSNKSSRRKVVIASISYALICFALLPLGLVKNEFFPKTDNDIFYIQLKLPSGTSINQTNTKALNFIDTLSSIPYITFITTEVGKSLSDLQALSSQDNQILYTLRLVPEKDRPYKSYEITEHLRNQFQNYSDTIQVLEVSAGPPAGADIQVTFLGDNLNDLETTADKAVAYLKQQPSVANPNKSLNPSTSQINFQIDSLALQQSQISRNQISQAVNQITKPQTLGALSLATETTDLPLVLNLTSQPPQVELLNQITIPNSKGQLIPLSTLGTWQAQISPQIITHDNATRSVTVTAATRPNFNTTQANQDLLTQIQSWQLPSNVTWKTGGVNQENARSIQSILLAMLLSAVLILITMVLQFSSFRAALIVILVIPLAVSSVFLAFALTQTPVSFPALIGILSLFGIVVTNSMFIVDKININLNQKMPFIEAIADAGASRLEPIILTKLSTILGLLPITLADPLWRGLGGAIISGIALASIIMLLFIPVVTYAWLKPNSANPTNS